MCSGYYNSVETETQMYFELPTSTQSQRYQLLEKLSLSRRIHATSSRINCRSRHKSKQKKALSRDNFDNGIANKNDALRATLQNKPRCFIRRNFEFSFLFFPEHNRELFEMMTISGARTVF